MTDEAPAAQADEDKPSRIGQFITKYPTFLSSLVVGIAGVIATSIWQYRQSQTQKAQADAAQRVAETQAANSWKIERADILAKNLETLASTGSASADQRFGVLLSLTRAEILDPELAVSYALELGKDNAEYMQSVLANTPNKDWGRIARAFTLSCEERFGVSSGTDSCVDKFATRSDALGQLVSDALGDQPGPTTLLKDERRVQLDVQQLTGLFETAVEALYERRQWDELAKLQALSPGAHLVSSLVLAAARTGEFVTDEEAKTLAQFHTEQTKWLSDYLTAKGCDAECKARMLEVMLSHYEEAQGDFDAAVRKLLVAPHQQSGIAVTHLHSRLLWCQVDSSDLVPLRDHVLVPAAHDSVKDAAARDALISLLALVPEPTGDPAWAALVADPAIAKVLRDRRAIADKQRKSPPPAMRRFDFCDAVAPPGQ